MKFKFIFLFLIILLIQTHAQNKFDLPQFADETFQFVKQPLIWEGNDWIKLGLAGTATFLMVQADQPIRDFFGINSEYKKSAPMELGRMYGELYSPVAIAGLFGVHSLINDDKSTRKIAFEILQTTFYAGIITTALKFAIGRTRPFVEAGPKSFGNWSVFDDTYHSLPSGHTTVAFSISTVLANNTKSDLLKIFAYLPAVLTAISRVYQDDHWASDVLLGGIVGYTTGSWVTSKHETKMQIQLLSSRRIGVIIPLN